MNGAIMIDRLLSVVIAVSLALLIWLYTHSRDQETIDNVPIPIEVVLPPKLADLYTLEMGGTPSVVVSFTGPPMRLRELQMMLQHKEIHVLKTITVPEERLDVNRLQDAVALEASDIKAPLGVTPIVTEGRNRIPYTLHRVVERRLPVRFDPLREAPLVPPIFEPATVLVRGPREVLDRIQSIPTQPSELPTRSGSAPANAAAVGRLPMVEELEGRPVRVTPSRVNVRVTVLAQKMYEVNDLQVHFLCPPNFHLSPKFFDERTGRVSLKLIGPAKEEPPKVHAFIDLTKGKFVSGLNHEPLQIQLPKDYQLAQEVPRVVTFELLPGDFRPDGLGMPAPADEGKSGLPIPPRDPPRE
jgi:hypothetical protein